MSVSELQSANAKLKSEVAELKAKLADSQKPQFTSENVLAEPSKGAILMSSSSTGQWGMAKEDRAALTDRPLTIIVIGASGDLAVKKTFPALFSLYIHGLLPPHTSIAGYARSEITPVTKFHEKISKHFDKDASAKEKSDFLAKCFYTSGQYDKAEDFAKLIDEAEKKESAFKTSAKGANRIFYFAIPPNVFVPTAQSIASVGKTTSGWNRVIVEKPFGHDSESSYKLGVDMSRLFSEDQIYRIDHYLGKEMVQNLMTLRFSNKVMEPIWSSQHISNVQITFKEPFGTQESSLTQFSTTSNSSLTSSKHRMNKSSERKIN